MATTTTDLRRRAMAATRTRSNVDLVTGLLALAMTFGTYADGWAHTHLIDDLESFFTPWHGLLYAGYAAVAVWIGLHRDRPGYKLGFAGALLFGAGGMVDMVWHTLFGIEADAEALISPPHLLLFAAHLMIVSTPLRAAWISASDRNIDWRSFTAPALSLVGLVASISFMFMYATPMNDWLPSERFGAGVFGPETRFRLAQKGALGSYLWSSVMYTTPLLAVLTRWRPPFGTATLAIGIASVGIAVIDPLLLGAPQLALAGIVMGFVADVLIALLDPSPDRSSAYRLFGALVPIALPVVSLSLIAARWGLAWTAPLIGGAVLLTAMIGLGLAVVLSLPRAAAAEVVAR